MSFFFFDDTAISLINNEVTGSIVYNAGENRSFSRPVKLGGVITLLSDVMSVRT